MNTTTSFKIKDLSPQLHVADIERSVDFYTKKLGFDVRFRYEDFYSAIVKDGHSIHLKSGGSQAEMLKSKEDLDVIFAVSEIAEVYEEISSRHVEVIQPLRDMPYGKEFYIADPDGNVIAFVES